MVPSTTSSPTCTRMPPMTSGSRTTLTWTGLAVDAARAAASRCRCASSSGTAAVTVAVSCSRRVAATARYVSSTRSKRRPRGARTAWRARRSVSGLTLPCEQPSRRGSPCPRRCGPRSARGRRAGRRCRRRAARSGTARPRRRRPATGLGGGDDGLDREQLEGVGEVALRAPALARPARRRPRRPAPTPARRRAAATRPRRAAASRDGSVSGPAQRRAAVSTAVIENRSSTRADQSTPDCRAWASGALPRGERPR